MLISDPPEHLRLFLQRNFLDEQLCRRIRAEARLSEGFPAPVYIDGTEGSVHESVRKTTSVNVSADTVSVIEQRLLDRRAAIAEYFGITLTDCERPQFLLYRSGDFFVRHQDGNTEQLEFDHLRIRKVSIVVFLNAASERIEPDSFQGGSLVFYEPEASQKDRVAYELNGEPGLLVAFPSETLHEVKPVISGERYIIVSWFR